MNSNSAGTRSALRPILDHDPLFQLIRDQSFRLAKPGETFTLASGEKSNYFFDLKRTMLDPVGINLLADRVLDQIVKTGAHYVGGLAMGAVPVVVATVLKSTGRDYLLKGFWVRKEQKDHGTKSKAEGYIVPDSKVVIVDDVTTKGGSVLTAIKEARDQGCAVVSVITIVDREEGAAQLLRENGVELNALYSKSQFFNSSGHE